MAELVVPGVCRFSIVGSYDGHAIANILDMDIDTVGVSTRAESIADQADVIWNNWADLIMPNISSLYSMTEVRWVDLNSADGTTGSINTTGTNPAPQVGGAANTGFPGSVAFLVKKVINAERGRRDGRMFVCGATEGLTPIGDANEMATASVATLQGTFNALLTAINQTSGFDPPFYDSGLSVVHILTRDALGHPLTGDHRQVSSLQVQQTLATQRRRLRR